MCIYLKYDNSNTRLIAASHIDDCIMAGPKGVLEQFKLKKHLGIWYNWKEENNGKKYIVVTRPKLVKEITESYKEHMTCKAKILIARRGTPGIICQR
jgi:hypothetical protein